MPGVMKHMVFPVPETGAAGERADERIDSLRHLLERERKARIEAEAVAERSWRDLYENQVRLALLQRITDASNQSSDFKAALGIALAEICAHMNWDVGHAYRIDLEGKARRQARITYAAEPDRFRPIMDASRRQILQDGEDLPGRVLRDRHPHWIDQMVEDKWFPRRDLALESGLQSACAFPVLVGEELVAVMEFFSRRPLVDKDNILLTVTQASTQLARVVERERARTALLHEARHDAMTGLPNRVLLDERARAAFARLQRSGKDLAMMVIDLDGFKAVNDKHGHHAGDALLIEVARRFNRVVAGLRGKTGWPGPSPRITLARVGGDEFVMLLDMLTDRRLPEFLANRLLVALREPMPIDGELVAVGASIGIAHGGGDYTSIEQIRRDADLAMYEAKGAGRDRIVTFTDALGSDVRRRMALERELREAIRENQFLLFYQPIFCLGDTPYLLGFEALIRWAHPTRGTLSPDAFIPAAEASGLIVFIGDWVMRQACTALARLHRLLPAHNRPFVSVNIAPQQFLQPDFTQSVRRAIADSGLPPRCLKLEVTEGVAIIDAARTRAVLEEIRAWGVQTSLDDFGTGYSSLSYLKNLPFDSLKIDRSFTASIDDPKSRDIIQTILDLAGKLGLTVVAEGIESSEQDRMLQSMGCTFGQGFHLAPPLEETAAFALAAAEAPTPPA